jgi:hypothetical protein
VDQRERERESARVLREVVCGGVGGGTRSRCRGTRVPRGPAHMVDAWVGEKVVVRAGKAHQAPSSAWKRLPSPSLSGKPRRLSCRRLRRQRGLALHLTVSLPSSSSASTPSAWRPADGESSGKSTSNPPGSVPPTLSLKARPQLHIIDAINRLEEQPAVEDGQVGCVAIARSRPAVHHHRRPGSRAIG